MKPRFRADWDRFASFDIYKEFTEAWLTEAKRCLEIAGSIFIWCCQFNIGLIDWTLRTLGFNVVQHIDVYKLDGRPLIGRARNLQHSYHTIIWATRDGKAYRFNDRHVKLAAWPDPFNDRRGRMKRNIWLVPNSRKENTTNFPAQKPVEEYSRVLLMTGKTGGRMLDIFGGAGTGAIAALRSAMNSTTIERNPVYVRDIISRITAELRKRR